MLLHLDAANPSSYPGSGTTWFDLTVNDLDGILTNGPTFNTDNGGNIVIDSTDDYINLGTDTRFNFSGTEAGVTVNMWFRVNSWYAAWQTLFAKGDTQGFRVARYAASVPVVLNAVMGPVEINNTSTIATGVWYNLTVTWERGVTTKMYINAVVETTSGASNSLNPVLAAPLWIGANSDKPGRNLNGGVGVFMLYNRPLSGAEVTQNFNALKSRYGL